MRENRLKTLPKSMARLVELERLDIGTNEFDTFVNLILKQYIILVKSKLKFIYNLARGHW